jgi:HSP20 family protein
MRRRVSSGWELELIQRHVDELLNLLAVPRRASDAGFSPTVDLQQSVQAYVVRVDLPGVPASELMVSLRERDLRISGRKPPATEQAAKGHCHHMERSFGTFSVEVSLPGPVHPKEARATLRAGVLEVTLPRLRDTRGSTYTIPITGEEP